MDLFAHQRGRPKRRKLAAVLDRLCALGLALAIMTAGPVTERAAAQDVGDTPPSEAIRAAGAPVASDDSAGTLQISAFMFLDKNNNLVYVPGMTYEKWEQLESGADQSSQVVVFEPLTIKGRVYNERAELEIDLQLTVEPTGGQLVSIPLEMGNFHLLRSAEISSRPQPSERDLQLIDTGEKGLELKIRSDKRRKYQIKLGVAALVESGPPRLLKFQLPKVPSNIQIEMDAANLEGEIVGNQRTTLKPSRTSDGRTKFNISGGGETFLLQWRDKPVGIETTPRLEAESLVRLEWGSPQDDPIASVKMTIRNLRDRGAAIDRVQVELPPGAVTLDTPVLESNGRQVEDTALDPKRPHLRTYRIPEGEQNQRIVLQFDLHMDNNARAPGSNMQFRVPRVADALRQQGEVIVETTDDYRLRWQPSKWIRAFFRESLAENADNRFYHFRFDRGDFVLPISLTADQRRLRVTSESRIKVTESLARMEMDLQLDGQVADSRTIKFDPSGWRVISVVDSNAGEMLQQIANEAFSIEINAVGNEQSEIKLIAERAIKNSDNIRFELPRIESVGEDVSLGASFVTLQGSGRSAMVVTLSESNGLERISLDEETESFAVGASRFQVAPGEKAIVVGSLEEQPQQITLASEADVVLAGNTLTSKVAWKVTPQVDLVGSLPIRIPGFLTEGSSTKTATTKPDAEAPSGLPQPLLSGEALDGQDEAESTSTQPTAPWTVTVDRIAARLVHLGGDRFELQSPLLGTDEVAILWTQQLPLQSVNTERIETLNIPIPGLADVTIRGDVLIRVSGDSRTDLFAAEGVTKNEIVYQQLLDQVRLRLVKRTTSDNDLSIRKVVLRSAIGSRTRQEQFVAQVQGGSTLELGLPVGTGDLDVAAFVDGKKANVRRDRGALQVPLPGDAATHIVDLSIWAQEPAVGLLVDVQPTLQIPVRAGRVHWQIVTPRDSHVVWAAPALGRAMTWKFHTWGLNRDPLLTNAKLSEWIGAELSDNMPIGNEYLYIGTDMRSFHARTMTRPWLWFLVGGFVLGMAWLLTYVPATRNPLTAVAGAVLFAGLLAIAPDAAIMVGQLSTIALVLVIVMYAVRSVLQSPLHDRVLQTTRSEVVSKTPSTRSMAQATQGSASETPPTHSLPIPSATRASK